MRQNLSDNRLVIAIGQERETAVVAVERDAGDDVSNGTGTLVRSGSGHSTGSSVASGGRIRRAASRTSVVVESPKPAASDKIQIICRYDSQHNVARTNDSVASTVVAETSDIVDDFSSIVEIDGNSFTIMSRADSDDGEETEGVDREEDSITERCRRFYENRLKSRRFSIVEMTTSCLSEKDEEAVLSSADSGQESGSDGASSDPEESTKPSAPPANAAGKPASSFQLKMALLRREMSALMRQDNDLFRQLLALNDSIEALRRYDEELTLSPASSVASLPGVLEEEEERERTERQEEREDIVSSSCSPISTLSSSCSRQSHLSSDSGNYAEDDSLAGSRRRQHRGDLKNPGDGSPPRSSTSGQKVAGSTAHQVAGASTAAGNKSYLFGHRKQGSQDSGIMEQELREKT